MRLYISAFVAVLALPTFFCSQIEDFMRMEGVEQHVEWQQFSVSAGADGFIKKKYGIKNLVVYAAHGAGAKDELKDVADSFLDYGFNIIVPGPAGRSRVRLSDIIRHAATLPGYKRKLILTHVSEFQTVLEFCFRHPKTFSGLIVVGPASVLNDDPSFQYYLHRSLRITIVWISPADAEERLLRTPSKKIFFIKESSLSKTREQGKTIPKKVFSNAAFTDRLLALGLAPVWRNAGKVFPNGCALQQEAVATSRGKKFSIENYRTSAARDGAFCPLFLKSPRDELLRAVKIVKDGCVYSGADRTREFLCN